MSALSSIFASAVKSITTLLQRDSVTSRNSCVTASFVLGGGRVPKARALHGRATFAIDNGPVFYGTSFGAHKNAIGEAVFTTSLVGYPESMTDPSYRGQILVFTQPLIGNYGVPAHCRDEFGFLKYFESPQIQPEGVVVAGVSEEYSHWTAVESLGQWCDRQGVPAISGVDTRAIVTYLRNRHSNLARITASGEHDRCRNEASIDYGRGDIVREVSTKAPFHVSAPSPLAHVAVIDCGVKENMLRSLVSRGASITVLPHDYRVHLFAHHFDGVFISNGPGDPMKCTETIHNVRKVMELSEIPIFGVCLGHQLIALAANAKTIRLEHGHRAHNVPALDTTTGRCYITAQNHGYAVDESTLDRDWKPYFVNLNDGSNEGIIHRFRPIFSTQFHPEFKGGPQDTAYLFDVFLENVKRYKGRQNNGLASRLPILSQASINLLSKQRVIVANPRRRKLPVLESKTTVVSRHGTKTTSLHG